MNKPAGVTFLVVITLFLVLFNVVSLSMYFNKDSTITGKAVSSNDKVIQPVAVSNNTKTTSPKTEVTSSIKSTSSSKSSSPTKTPSSVQQPTLNATPTQQNITPPSPTPPTQEPKPGIVMFSDNYSGSDEEFSIGVYIESNTSIISLNYELSFDNTLVEVNNIIGGDYFSKQGDSFPYEIINNTAGKVSYIETLYGGGSASGNGTIGVISFKRKQPGKFTLQFTKSQVILPNIEMLNATSRNSTIELV